MQQTMKHFGKRVVWLTLFMGLSMVQSAAAASSLQETDSIWGGVLTHIIVIVGATLLVSAWQKWRDGRQKKDNNQQ
jgi:hypothetical protein